MKKILLSFLAVISFSVPVLAADKGPVERVDNKWSITVQSSILGDGDRVNVKILTNQSGSMHIRCEEKTTEVFFYIKEFIGIESTIFEYKIDNNPIVKTTANPSANGSAFFIRQPIQFLKKLYGAKMLAIRIAPYGKTKEERVFDIEGIEQATEQIRKTCNWK